VKPPVTERFADFIAGGNRKPISDAAIRNAKLHILDTFGVALAALSDPVSAIALDYCRRVGGKPEATVWGPAVKTSAPMAAFTNGLLAHAMDFDDWDAVARVGHPSCMVVAAALAAAEAKGASGRDFLTAYVVGIEIAAQIAFGSPNIHKRGFHSTPIFGSMGAAAAAASIVGLTPEKIKAAFGVAASGASGIHRQQGSMVKPFHAGNAARNGLEAALLAELGFTADEAIIENPAGFCDTLFGEGQCNYERMLAGLGDPYYLDSPGLAFKLHPCSAPQFLAADATLHLVREHRPSYKDIRRVEIKVCPIRHRRHYRPSVRTGLQGKFAINYVSAIAILEGKLEKESFTDAKVNEPVTQEALGKIEVLVDPNIPEEGEFCPVTIELNDGTKVSYTATIAKGHPDNPLSEEEVFDKFRSNVKSVLSHERSEALIASVSHLETLRDVHELTELLRAGA